MKNNKNSQRLLLVLAMVVLLVIILFIVTIGSYRTDTIKVGVVLTGDIGDDGWNGQHYQGIKDACDKLEAELLIKEDVEEGTGRCEEAIRELVKEEVSMIILTSYAYPMEVEEVIKEYPEVAFYAISAEYLAENMTSYFGRMYQARYLAGIVAGKQTQENSIGYVAAMPNVEVNRGINAFTLGVKSVNPNAVVHVLWTESWDNSEREAEAVNTLIEQGSVDVITYHQNQHYVAETADEAGIYSIGYNATANGLSDKYLTAAVWDWNALYYEIVREFLQGKGNSVRSHWFGMDTGVVKLSEYSPLVSEETKQLVEAAKQEIIVGRDVFSHVIYDNQGQLRCNKDEAISDEILLEKMDWYVDGVMIYEEKDKY